MNTDTHSDYSSASVAGNTREPRNETRETYPEREQRLELALIKLIKSRFASYQDALKWANQYRNNPQVDVALLQAIDAVEDNPCGFKFQSV